MLQKVQPKGQAERDLVAMQARRADSAGSENRWGDGGAQVLQQGCWRTSDSAMSVPMLCRPFTGLCPLAGCLSALHRRLYKNIWLTGSARMQEGRRGIEQCMPAQSLVACTSCTSQCQPDHSLFACSKSGSQRKCQAVTQPVRGLQNRREKSAAGILLSFSGDKDGEDRTMQS